jgi:LmbE family N-acetylglucosaminyl deacetylase
MLDFVTSNDRILILSPHLDDAVLSAGGLIDKAVKQGSFVVVATIFTSDIKQNREPSLFAKDLHEWWALGSSPFEARRYEDVAAIKLLGASYEHGDLEDAIYRNCETGTALYATREAVFSPPSTVDPAFEALDLLISVWVKTFHPTIILCPMAVGRHVDHVITTSAVRRKSSEWPAPVFLYEDIPYSAGFFPRNFPDNVVAAVERSEWAIRNYVDVEVDFDAKFSAIAKYKSQLAEIFPNLNPEKELRHYMRSEAEGIYRERFWTVG